MKALYILSISILFSCNNPAGNETVINEVDSSLSTMSANSCFELRQGDSLQDITYMEVTINDDSIHGTLEWVPFEKDAARGTIAGIKRGDTLYFTYNYMIEGINQSEEMIWLNKGNRLLKKTGELVSDSANGTHFRLKNPAAAQFDMSMYRVECRNNK